MSGRAWLGGVYLKEEGGYAIVLKSLRHYKKRLKTIGSGPELKGAAAMFASVLGGQAAKTIPKIDEVTAMLERALTDPGAMAGLAREVSFLVKALECHDADICKARDTGHEYFVGLVGDLGAAGRDLAEVRGAIKRISEFS